MKRVSKELLQRWAERKNHILSSSFSIASSEEDKEKRITKARKNYKFFVHTYFPHLAKSETATFQISAANYIKSKPRAFALFEWARGMAKSSHISTLIPLWLLIQEYPSIHIMILVSKSEEAAKGLLADIQAELEFNTAFKEDYGNLVGAGDWKDGNFTTSSGVTFRALGREQSPRGLKRKGNRPDYIVIDDIDDDELVRNPHRIGKITDWCLSALFGTMAVGRGRFIVVGNRIGKDSVLSRIAQRPKIYHTKVNILDKNGNPTWYQNHTLEEIAEIRMRMGERAFQKEYMNNPISEGSVFKRKHIHFVKTLPLKNYRTLICYTDPSFKSSDKSDFKATVLVGKTIKGEYHILKVYAEKTTISRMVEWHYEILNYVSGKVPVRFYMEANFIQDLLLEEFKKEGEAKGLHIPITPDSRKKPDKFARIEAMQPLFERSLIVFDESEKDSPGVQVLIDQLLSIERGSRVNDDAPDALEGAIWILTQRALSGNATYRVGARPNRHY